MATLEHGMLFKLGEDPKYGKVFIERPPESLKLKFDQKGDGEEITEPLFILRAQDVHALRTLFEYQSASMDTGTPEFNERVERVIEAFEKFRAENVEAMKVPD